MSTKKLEFNQIITKSRMIFYSIVSYNKVCLDYVTISHTLSYESIQQQSTGKYTRPTITVQRRQQNLQMKSAESKMSPSVPKRCKPEKQTHWNYCKKLQLSAYHATQFKYAA